MSALGVLSIVCISDHLKAMLGRPATVHLTDGSHFTGTIIFIFDEEGDFIMDVAEGTGFLPGWAEGPRPMYVFLVADIASVGPAASTT
jgi:hypothetical protein